MFGFKKKETQEKDEAQLFLESVQDAPEMPDPDEAADEALDELAKRDAKAHYDILNLLVLAVIVIFFGVVFMTLTNKQDFSGDNKLTKESFWSGNYLARVERNFNESLPLRDRLHNAESRIKYCFGIGNKTDIIDIKAKNQTDDPYSIDNDTVENVPLSDSTAEDTASEDENTATTQPPQNVDEDDAGTNKKLDTIRLPATTTEESSSSEAESTTTVNTAPPGATTTTTVPPETTTTSAPVTEPPQTTTTEPTETTTTTAETTNEEVTEPVDE